jgi:hypothetical protein
MLEAAAIFRTEDLLLREHGSEECGSTEQRIDELQSIALPPFEVARREVMRNAPRDYTGGTRCRIMADRSIIPEKGDRSAASPAASRNKPNVDVDE